MIPIQSIMSTDVKYVKSSTPIYEALNLLTKYKVSGLPVVDDSINVVGILSEKDVLELLLKPKPGNYQTVEDYMSRNVICFTEEDDAIDICRFFVGSHIRRVPILRDGKLIGIVSRRDIVKVIHEAHEKMSDFRYV